ncbi:MULTISPECIES: DUF1523 family protein [Paenirhodobacter]|uniref:DUF1523 family protein n=2 Tax=Paenirhodobacter TaxID=1470577 RepID=A0A421BWQ4_9RHOB|nr:MULTISPECIES: DUF1523 family protein [Sinirhodobacter]RLL72761.1 DUF1523 family protein [Sinirhodobacter hankyongi]RWR50897.1 DUF1523 family protein [Sinirhodobacter ferrireducens]
MRYVKWAFWTVIVLVVGGFLHYTLPQHDIVRVVGTYQERQDLTDWTRIFWSTPDDQSGTLTNRDVQFIQAIRANGKPMVYRNEDTGWRWPPYFKFDTATLQTQADDLRSTAEAPKWAVVTHYGWRNQFLSIFPNAVGIRPVAGPDVRIIPWVNIVILGGLLVLILLIRAMWRQFRERTIEPLIDEAADKWDELGDRAEAMDGKARGFWARLVGRGRK